jgi:hypothetical protein
MHNVFRMVNIQLLFISMHHFAADILAEDIDVCAGEFSCADATFEKEIEFGEGAAHGFGEAEIDVYYAAEADAALGYFVSEVGMRGEGNVPRKIRCNCPSSRRRG